MSEQNVEFVKGVYGAFAARRCARQCSEHALVPDAVAMASSARP